MAKPRAARSAPQGDGSPELSRVFWSEGQILAVAFLLAGGSDVSVHSPAPSAPRGIVCHCSNDTEIASSTSRQPALKEVIRAIFALSSPGQAEEGLTPSALARLFAFFCCERS